MCFEDTLDPVNYASIDTVASRWHNLCDSVVTFQPTTPPISSISTQLDTAFCFDTVYPICNSVTILLNQCTRNITSDFTSASSCLCQPLVLSYAYTCGFLGNTSCISVPATLSEVFGYSVCDNFNQVIGTGLVCSFLRLNDLVVTYRQSVPTLTRIVPSSGAATTAITPASPGSIHSSGSQASPTSSSSGCGRENMLVVGWALRARLVAGLFIAILLR
jgi:hypothetical protein